MKALFIGGTGTISTEISKLCAARGWELTLLNRGSAGERVPAGAQVLHADIGDEAAVRSALAGRRYDVVADFIVFTPEQAQRDLRLFADHTSQYIFISSASAYRKPLGETWITEATPLNNPFWGYSRNKAACEEMFLRAWREREFPVTIVRPSHTYCERSIPVGIHGARGSFSVVERMRTGRKVIVPGDGSSLWTLTHSRDFAKGFVGLMGNPRAIGETYHITSDEHLTWDQIYRTTAAALGMEAQLVHIASETLGMLCEEYVGALLGDKSHTVLFDNTKLKRAVPDFCAATRFDEGAREAVAYIYNHPECQVPDPEFDEWCDAVIEGYERMTASLPRLTL